MTDAPILARGSYREHVPMVYAVHGGLCYLKGNKAPHFSLTYWAHRKGHPGQCESGGAGHDFILKRHPRLADLAALHLADINGVPMHAEANAWYWLAGALGGAGERYHGGQDRGREACIRIFSEHVRITFGEACDLIGEPLPAKCHESVYTKRRAALAAWIEQQKPRWKAEADACIKTHGLVVYGDPWESV